MGHSKLPIFLYDINNRLIKERKITVSSPSFYFYSYQNIGVQIMHGDGTLYSVTQREVPLEPDQEKKEPEDTEKSQNPETPQSQDQLAPDKTSDTKTLPDDSDSTESDDSEAKTPGTSEPSEPSDDSEKQEEPDIQQYLDIRSGKFFGVNDNFGYTLHIPQDKSTVTVIVTSSYDNSQIVLEVTLNLPNQITDENEHYNDLLINNYLPTLEELEPAILPGTDKRDIIKRLLLDFRDIMRSKGTKKSIEKFFYFIGFMKEQLSVREEYRRPDGILTLTPNTYKDTKTGNYHVLYNNWDDGTDDGKQALNSKNLPYRPFDTEDFELFYECLKYAIPLANKYFTLVEQEIVFFGISFSANVPMFQGITSMFNQIFYNDVQGFRKFLHIDLFYHSVSYKGLVNKTFLVKNCLQVTEDAYRSEVKYLSEKGDVQDSWIHNIELYWVDREVDDNEEYSDDIVPYYRAFGVILHLTIKSPHTYLKVKIYNTANELSCLEYDKTWCEDTLELQFLTEKSDVYKVIVDVYDEYNCWERYFYNYRISDDIARIDFETFNSLKMSDKNSDENYINLDVDSGTITTKPTAGSKNFILPIETVPENLDEYFMKYTGLSDLRWLTDASDSSTYEKHPQYIIPEINRNIIVDEVTDTIPIELSSQWLKFGTIPTTAGTLCIRLYDAEYCDHKIIDIPQTVDVQDLQELYELYDLPLNRLFIRKIVIEGKAPEYHLDIPSEKPDDAVTEVPEEEIPKEYYFISPTETGIELNEKTFDILIKTETGFQSIYEHAEFSMTTIPVNYDFPLFPTPTQNSDIGYFVSSGTPEVTVTTESGDKVYPLMKSMFPRTINIESPEVEHMQLLKLGDVILCRLNTNYVVNEMDVVWTISNAFTGEQMFTTTDYMLKYRIDDNTIFTVTCEFYIGTDIHKIIKTGLISAFKEIIYD